MIKETIELPKSAACTGIAEQKTPIVPIKGIPEGAKLIHFNVDIENNIVKGIWQKKRHNNEGTEIQSQEFAAIIRDIGEIGEVMIDPITRQPDMNTYKKKKDENPVLTNYFNQLGDVILTPMLNMIAADNGYVVQEEK